VSPLRYPVQEFTCRVYIDVNWVFDAAEVAFEIDGFDTFQPSMLDLEKNR